MFTVLAVRSIMGSRRTFRDYVRNLFTQESVEVTLVSPFDASHTLCVRGVPCLYGYVVFVINKILFAFLTRRYINNKGLKGNYHWEISKLSYSDQIYQDLCSMISPWPVKSYPNHYRIFGFFIPAPSGTFRQSNSPVVDHTEFWPRVQRDSARFFGRLFLIKLNRRRSFICQSAQMSLDVSLTHFICKLPYLLHERARHSLPIRG